MARTNKNKAAFKKEIIRSVIENDHRAIDALAYALQKKNLSEEVLEQKGYAGTLLEIVRRLPIHESKKDG